MTYLTERLVELRRHLDHLRDLRPRVTGREALERDLSLRNDVLFSLLTVCQLVIDIAGDLSARRGERFEDYTEAVRSLGGTRVSPPRWCAGSNPSRDFATSSSTSTSPSTWLAVVDALDRLGPVEHFLVIVRDLERGGGGLGQGSATGCS